MSAMLGHCIPGMKRSPRCIHGMQGIESILTSRTRPNTFSARAATYSDSYSVQEPEIHQRTREGRCVGHDQSAQHIFIIIIIIIIIINFIFIITINTIIPGLHQ